MHCFSRVHKSAHVLLSVMSAVVEKQPEPLVAGRPDLSLVAIIHAALLHAIQAHSFF